jgi:hypothetical protein
MWRAFFLAVGISSCVAGLECMAVDKVVLASRGGTAPAEAGAAPAGPRELLPPEWAPWSLLSGGAVVMLYSVTIPKKLRD